MVIFGSIFIAILGKVLYEFPINNINHWIGYRTSRSKKNQANWEFSQKYSSQLMVKLFSIMSIIFIPFLIFDILAIIHAYNNTLYDISTILQIAILTGGFLLLIGRTERAIKRFEQGQT